MARKPKRPREDRLGKSRAKPPDERVGSGRRADSYRGDAKRFASHPPKILETLEDGTEVRLSVKERKVLLMAVAGVSHLQIARETGYSTKYIGMLCRGRDMPHVREAFRKLLEIKGLDAQAILEKIVEMMNATKPYFNAETRTFEMFPDNAVQLRAAEFLSKLLNLQEPHQVAERSGAVNVQIITNLDDGGVPAPEGTYEIDVTPASQDH